LNPIAKVIVGLILMGISVYAVYYYESLLPAFITVVKGIVPAFVFLLGLFIVWLELDELRIEKELKTERKRVVRKKKKRGKR